MYWSIKTNSESHNKLVYQELVEKASQIKSLVEYYTLMIDYRADEVFLKLEGASPSASIKVSKYLARAFPDCAVIQKLRA